jgi:hypothetical protein
MPRTTGGGVDRRVLARRRPEVGDLPVVVVIRGLGGGGGAMVFPELPLEPALVGGLRPQYL